jgi:two-component system, NarL family, sensor histidine kinase UhpB
MCAKKVWAFIILFFPAVEACSQTSVIDSLQKIVAMHTRDTNEIKALDLLNSEFLRKDIEKAKYYAYQQIALAKSLGTDFGLSSAYSGLAGTHQNAGLVDSAWYYLDRLEALAKKRSTDKKVSAAYLNAAGLFYKHQGKYKEALPYLLEALRILEAGGDKTSHAGQLLNVGNAYNYLGDMKNAADYHLKALALFEEVKNKRGQSFCLQGIGNDYFELGQYAVSEKYFLQSEKLKEELGDKRGVIGSWMALGTVYQHTNKPELAMHYLSKTLERARELKLTLEQARTLFNIGSLLKTEKKNSEADKMFLEALPLARQSGDSGIVSRIHAYRVALRNDMQKEKEEEQTLLQNIEISSEKGTLVTTAEGHFQLADWYASRKQFEKAFDNLKRGRELQDSASGSQVILQLKRLEEEYKNEKKEKEIVLLKKDQELQTLALSRQKVIITSIIIAFALSIVIGLLLVNRYRAINRTKRLIEIERVRNNIARDLHDDIGSALSSINILSQVGLHEDNGNAQNYFQRIGEQASQTMEDMSDMVWSINPRNDSMSEVIIRMREFAAEILESKNIEYRFIEKVGVGLTLNADQKKNLFLIFKESVNNAAKYSNAGEIEISLHEEDHVLSMRIKDNGQGFDEHSIKTGNGLRNLRERAKEMNGTVALKSKEGQGTEVELVLPLA